MPILSVHTPNNEPFLVDLDSDKMVVGRSDDSDIQIMNAFVSKRHAKLKRVAPGIYEITDLNGKNGTFVNGIKIQQHTLNPGDIIFFGGTNVWALYKRIPSPNVDVPPPVGATSAPNPVKKLSADSFNQNPEPQEDGSKIKEGTQTQKVTSIPVGIVTDQNTMELLNSIIEDAKSGANSNDLVAQLEKLKKGLN